MSPYAYHRNTSVVHVVNSWESILPATNDERRANWAVKYFARGDHRKPAKPRIRVTVPEPLRQPAPPASAIPLAGDSPTAASARVQAADDINASPCRDSAQPPPVAAVRAGSIPTGDAA